MRWLLNFFRNSLAARRRRRGPRRRDPLRLPSALHVTSLEERRMLVAGVTVATGDGVAVTEGGTDDTYTLVLDEAPTGAVTITATADAQTQVSKDGTTFADSVQLTFTTSDWATAPERWAAAKAGRRAVGIVSLRPSWPKA